MPKTVGSVPRPGQFFLLVTWIVGVAASGCHNSSSNFERDVPDPGVAHAAVAATLESWLKGESSDVIVGNRADVHVVDRRRRGQRLRHYEIVGEVPAENARGFAVRLIVGDGEDKQGVVYLVVGTDPIWVFRQEDYEMIVHWMHPMTEPDDQATGLDAAP
jgi:hypothetical protein